MPHLAPYTPGTDLLSGFASWRLAINGASSGMEQAQEALRLQPTWSYVRDILLPQIETARRQRAKRS